MILLRLLGVGAVYGLGFMFVKSLFPEPFALLVLQGRQQRGQPDRTRPRLHGRRPDLRSHRSPLFGGILLLRRHGSGHASSGSRLALSLALALLMGLISGLLTLVAYATGILPAGGVLDPLRIIRASNFPTGTPLLVAWAIARDLLPAGLTGLFLSPVSGGLLQRLYAGERPREQRHYELEDF